jgi:uncharacterized repeat protein (TIGR01451 family)
VDCTFVNTKKASLTLQKTVVNDSGGAALDTAWTLNYSGPASGSGTEGQAAVTGVALEPGTYTLSESNGPAGYTQTGLACTGTADLNPANGLTLAAGENATCTFTNNDDGGLLTLQKTVVNDSGGTALDGAWTLNFSGPASGSGVEGAAAVTSKGVPAGTYTLSESSGPAGYTQTGLVCSGAADTNPADGLTIANNEIVTCTFTNDDDAATLTLVKNPVNDHGGTAAPGDWTLNYSGPASGTAASGQAVSVPAGAYTISESNGPSGYTQTDLSCVDDDEQSPVEVDDGELTVANGQNVTCTFTNDDQPVSLTLVKEVVNNDVGTKEPSDFILYYDGPDNNDGNGEGGVTNTNLPAGTYALSEMGLEGYTASDWVCTGDGEQDGSNITLGNGQSATCTITNTAQPAKLTLVKNLPNDNGGTAQPDDFELTYTPDGGSPQQAMSGVEVAVAAGTYTLGETNLPGYTPGDWSCEGGSQDDNQITLENGQSATCTITNDDQPASLTLVKQVDNSGGGTAQPSEFILYYDGPDGNDGNGEGGVSATNLPAGDYALSETGLENYTPGPWVCQSTQTESNVPVTNDVVTLANGDNVTCTITNTSDPNADLSITKTDGVATYTPGGFVTYTITASNAGPLPVTGASVTDTFPPEITTASWTCVGAGGGTCTAAGSGPINDTVDLPLGGSVTYTVTASIDPSATGDLVNTAKVSPPEGTDDPTPANNEATDTDTSSPSADLAITKTDGVTTYTPGGSVTYTITASNAGPSPVTGASVTDTFPPEITTANWTCVGAGGGTCTAAGTGPINDTVDLPAGGSVTYTVTAPIDPSASGNLVNTAKVSPPEGTDDPTPGNNEATDTDSQGSGTLTIIKQTADQPSPTPFTFQVSSGSFSETVVLTPGADGPPGASQTISVPSGLVTVSEQTPEGWTLSFSDCERNDEEVIPKVALDEESEGSSTQVIEVGNGSSWTCTFVNTFIEQAPPPGTLTIVKEAIGGDGTTAFDFTVTTLGNLSLMPPANGSAQSAAFSVSPGTYTITEAATTGWLLGDLACAGATVSVNKPARKATVTLAANDNAVCTFTNLNEEYIKDHTHEVIMNFLKHRAEGLIDEGPDRARLNRRLPGFFWGDDQGGTTTGFAQTPFNFTATGDEDDYTLDFGTSLSQMLMYNEAQNQKKLMGLTQTPDSGLGVASPIMSALDNPAAANFLSHPSRQGFDAWVEGHYRHFEDDAGGADTFGHFGVVYVGGDYLVTDAFLVGALVQFDWAEETSRLTGSTVSGTGWMAGPYASFRLTPNVFLDGRVAWGQSDNDVDPFGLYEDSFETDRWLANINLKGNWIYNSIRFTPGVSYTYFNEEQKAYVDSNAILIEGQTLTVNRLEFGPEFGYRFVAADGTTFEPHIAIKGLWDIGGDLDTTVNGLDAGRSELRGKVEGGFLAQTAFGPSVRLDFAYDGIGDEDFAAWGGQMWLNIPLD